MYSSSEICDRHLKRGGCILSLQIHKFCPVKVSYRTFLIEMPNFKQIPILSLQLRSFFPSDAVFIYLTDDLAG